MYWETFQIVEDLLKTIGKTFVRMWFPLCHNQAGQPKVFSSYLRPPMKLNSCSRAMGVKSITRRVQNVFIEMGVKSRSYPFKSERPYLREIRSLFFKQTVFLTFSRLLYYPRRKTSTACSTKHFLLCMAISKWSKKTLSLLPDTTLKKNYENVINVVSFLCASSERCHSDHWQTDKVPAFYYYQVSP